MKQENNNLNDTEKVSKIGKLSNSITETVSIFSKNVFLLLQTIKKGANDFKDKHISIDYYDLAFHEKVSKRLIGKLNLDELNIHEDVTIDEILKKIADNTAIIDERFSKKTKLIESGVCENLLSDIEKDIIKKRKVECYSLGKIPNRERDYFDDKIYNHENDEFREDFLWYVMSMYGNYNFNKLLFNHFIDEHKEEFKIYNRIEYTTEIHKFLFQVVEDQHITMKEAFDKVFQGTSSGVLSEDLLSKMKERFAGYELIETQALYTLFYEIKGYSDTYKGGDDIISVIDRSLLIVKKLKNNNKRKELKNIKDILELIKLDGKKIDTKNILKYSKKRKINLFYHSFQNQDVKSLYNSLYKKDEVQEDSNERGFLSKISGERVALPTNKYLLKTKNNFSKKINSLNRNIQAKRSGYKDPKNVSDLTESQLEALEGKKSKISDEELLKKIKFIQAFEEILEENIESIRDEVNGKKVEFSFKRLLAKAFTKKGVEEIFKLITYTGKSAKLLVVFVVHKITFAILWPIIITLLYSIVKSDLVRRWRFAYELINGYRFDISPELKNFLIFHVDALMEIASLESRKLKVESILKDGADSLSPQDLLGYKLQLTQIEDELVLLEQEKLYKNIKAIIKKNIEFQGKSFHQELHGQGRKKVFY